MKDKIKFISQPNLEYFPLHSFYISTFSESNTQKNKFDHKVVNNYYLDLLELLKQKTIALKDTKWYVSNFDENLIEKSSPAIFIERNNMDMENFFIKYNVKHDIKNGYSLPITADFNKLEDSIYQYFFSLDNYFSDKNILNFYDCLIFKFFEEYGSKTKNFSTSDLEIIMKCMIEINVKYKRDFKMMSLADNAFTSRVSTIEADDTYYDQTYQVYPHRLVCAWKCVIKGDFTRQDIPQAAKVDNFMRGYTLVSTLADDEYFSSYNSDHVFKANLLEIRLQELGVLPYFEIV